MLNNICFLYFHRIHPKYIYFYIKRYKFQLICLYVIKTKVSTNALVLNRISIQTNVYSGFLTHSTVVDSDWSNYLIPVKSCSKSNAAKIEWSKFITKTYFSTVCSKRTFASNKGGKTAKVVKNDHNLTSTFEWRWECC